jgi:hypothetical protein
MLKRLGLGLLKGLLIGGGIGAGLQYGLKLEPGIVAGLFGFLIAMGVAGTTGVFAGKPPWQEGAWIESTLKGLVGVGLGALVYWAGAKWGILSIPLPGLAEPAKWTELPVVFGPAVAGVYGALVELDNTSDAKKSAESKGRVAKGRVVLDDDLELEEEPARRDAKKKRQA